MLKSLSASLWGPRHSLAKWILYGHSWTYYLDSKIFPSHSCLLNKVISWLWHCLLTYALGPSTRRTIFQSTLCYCFLPLEVNEIIQKIRREGITLWSIHEACSIVVLLWTSQLFVLSNYGFYYKDGFLYLSCPFG